MPLNKQILMMILVLFLVFPYFQGEADDQKSSPAEQAESKNEKNSSPDDKVEDLQAKREKAFSKKMTGATLEGTFTVDGKKSDKPAHSEKYKLATVKKVGGDKWLFQAQIQYGNTDINVPVLIDLFWADDTPVVSMTNVGIPGLGSGFSCRVLFHENRYAGTWQHGDVGGHMSGTIIEDEELQSENEKIPELEEASFISSLDQSEQPYSFWAPEKAEKEKTPLIVYLHSWSADYKQSNADWLKEAAKRNWIFLHPDFRGPNLRPEACGSPLARQDILDSMDQITRKYNVDPERIYLAGASGGGHMSLVMAAYHPDRFSAVSSWVPITNLEDWYNFHTPEEGKPKRYAEMVALSTGGAPGESGEIDLQYNERSPVFHLGNAIDLPVDILAGIHDGHTGSVPVDHTLKAYNTIAEANGSELITQEEMDLLLEEKELNDPEPSDLEKDSSLGRKIHLRRKSGKARVTIFEGTHEGIAPAGIEWLSRQTRKVSIN